MHKSVHEAKSRPAATRLNTVPRSAAPETRRTVDSSEPAPPLPPQFDFSQISMQAPGEISADDAAAVTRGLHAATISIPQSEVASLTNFLATDARRLVVHSGPEASAANMALRARAFAVGRHVVASSNVTPSTADTTFLHEAIHARQQNFAELPSDLSRLRFTSPTGAEESAAAFLSVHSVSNSPVAVARQPLTQQPQPQSPAIVPPATPSFADVFAKFKGTNELYAAAEKRQLALQALDLLQGLDDARRGGAELLSYFFSKGMTAEGERVMNAVVDAWTIDHAVQGSGVPAPKLAIFGPPAALEEAGETAARAGKHDLAFRLFGNAFLLLSFQAADASEHREQETSTPVGQQLADTMRALTYYPSVKELYASMRRILDFYNVLSDEAHKAGDDQMAASYSGLGLMLYTEIHENYVWDNDPETVAEVELVSSSRGDALRIHGENAKTQDVTALPGLPAPKEVTSTGKPGSLAPQWQKASDLTEALHNQVDLMRELKGYPEIQKEFGSADIDMNNLGDRLRVWKTMLQVYKTSSLLGGNGLSSLMELIHRYLRAYTFHTGYNVDDFGQSYLADNENTMPSDLAGRLERDCGVYALTVAYEVFRTAKVAVPPLHISFRVFTMPDHVTLVIDDLDTKDFYVVNNDRISPPKQGDPMREIAGQYAAIRKVKNLVAPAIEMKLGDTSQTDEQFRTQAWSNYKDSASWGLDVPPGKDREEVYGKYYEAEQAYDQQLPALESRLDALSGKLKSQDATQQLATLDAQAPALIQGAAPLLAIFESHGPRAPIATSRPDPALRNRLQPKQRFLYSTENGGRDHPLARTVMLLHFWRSIGHTFNPLQQVFWDDFQQLGTKAPDLAAELARYIATGNGATF